MKKIILFLLVIGIFFVLFYQKEEGKSEEELRAIFISYMELQEELKGKEEKIAKKNIETMIENIKDLDLNTIILQVRPACDAIYPSKIYPFSSYVTEEEGKVTFDILAYFLQESHEKGIKLLAWINPYRIRTTNDISSITPSSLAYSYLESDLVYISSGIYWNPSKSEVTDLIVEGVKEILEYPVDGILMDDYFYPDTEIDQKDYEIYVEEHPNTTEEEYRLGVVSNMIEKVHEECQKKNVKFGVSPDGNIENNYEKHYADVKKWMSSDKYIDFIMPQVYYGFYNSTKSYVKVIKEWDSFVKNNIDLYIALAFYKVGKEDYYAKTGQKEWLENDNIIMREVILSRNLEHYKGFSLFRYDSLFNQKNVTPTSKMELENLKKVVK